MNDNPQNNNQFAGLIIHTVKHPIILQTNTNRITGNMHLQENERIKDALNTSVNFISLTEVKIFNVDGLSLNYESDFLAVSLKKIIWVIEDSTKISEN